MSKSASWKRCIRRFFRNTKLKSKDANAELRPFWSRYLGFNWKLGIFLILSVCIPRFVLVLNANETGKYNMIGLVMLVSAVVPFLFLSKSGRKSIGLKSPKSPFSLILALIAGVIFSIVLYGSAMSFMEIPMKTGKPISASPTKSQK